MEMPLGHRLVGFVFVGKDEAEPAENAVGRNVRPLGRTITAGGKCAVYGVTMRARGTAGEDRRCPKQRERGGTHDPDDSTDRLIHRKPPFSFDPPALRSFSHRTRSYGI